MLKNYKTFCFIYAFYLLMYLKYCLKNVKRLKFTTRLQTKIFFELRFMNNLKSHEEV